MGKKPKVKKKLELEIGGNLSPKLGEGSCARLRFQIWGDRSHWSQHRVALETRPILGHPARTHKQWTAQQKRRH